MNMALDVKYALPVKQFGRIFAYIAEVSYGSQNKLYERHAERGGCAF